MTTMFHVQITQLLSLAGLTGTSLMTILWGTSGDLWLATLMPLIGVGLLLIYGDRWWVGVAGFTILGTAIIFLVTVPGGILIPNRGITGILFSLAAPSILVVSWHRDLSMRAEKRFQAELDSGGNAVSFSLVVSPGVPCQACWRLIPENTPLIRAYPNLSFPGRVPGGFPVTMHPDCFLDHVAPLLVHILEAGDLPLPLLSDLKHHFVARAAEASE